MSLGIGLECCHLMLAFGIWACLVNLEVAFGHLFYNEPVDLARVLSSDACFWNLGKSYKFEGGLRPPFYNKPRR